jgi:TIR domain
MGKRVFISYSKSDPEPTRELADFLTARGYSVWWDTNLTAGEIFRKTIDREINAADAVIVIWTPHSVTSDWVVAEADHGAQLVPRHSDYDMLNPSITATLAGVLDRRGLRCCERRPVSV